MNRSTAWTRPEIATVAGLVTGAVGIAALWAAGVEFPVYPPPGILILTGGTVFFSIARTRLKFAPVIPVAQGLFIIGGFLIEGMIDGTGVQIMSGASGTGAQIAQIFQLVGVATAVAAGITVLRARYRRRTVAA